MGCSRRSSAAAIVIDMSSISPVATRRLAARVAEQGGTMLDAPVSGGEVGAINATLSIMVGGDEAAFTRVKPILSAMGNPERIVYIGASGAGQTCKICNQVAIGGALAGVSEALALAKKAGVDAARVRQALLGGFAASKVLEVHGERMLTANYKPGFRALLPERLRLASEAASSNNVAMPATAIVASVDQRARRVRRRGTRLRGARDGVVSIGWNRLNVTHHEGTKSQLFVAS